MSISSQQLLQSVPCPDAARLTEHSVPHLPANVAVPGYDRRALVPSVVHFGVGGFHRAHQGVYFDDLAREGVSLDWGIVGVGLHRPQLGEVLAEQDNLYTVVIPGSTGSEVRVVGALVQYLFAPEDPDAVLAALARPTTRLVTLSITGTAYPTGGLDPEQEDVRRDIERPESPGTAFGYIVEGLNRRRLAGLPAFTVLSCDNVQNNGVATREAVLGTARLRDPGLAEWIEASASFPGSMVDRITPETARQPWEDVADEYGVGDCWPVLTESFRQWIVEDSFCAGRPPLDRVGVQFVEDVRLYETMKTRMLNGAHSGMGHLARLAGFETTDQAMGNQVMRRFVEGYLAEVADSLPEIPGIDLHDYAQTLVERFSNPCISDQISRLCRRSSTKVPSYVLPSLRVAFDEDRPRAHLVLAVAAWLRYLRGEDYAGGRIEIEDVHHDRLQSLALEGNLDPRPLLTQHDLFDQLGRCPRFTAEVEQALRLLEAGPLEAAASVAAFTLESREGSAA